MYGIGCITLAFIYDVGVDLGSFYVCMSKHSLDGIDIRVMFKLQGGEGVTGTIKSFIHFCRLLIFNFDICRFSPILSPICPPR